MASKISGETAFLGTTPWICPLPSRKMREQQLAAFAKVIEPATNGDGLAVVFADFCDRG